MAVVDLQRQQAQRGCPQPAADVIASRETALLAAVGTLVLTSDQRVADAILATRAVIPQVPGLTAHVMHDLGGIVFVIDVARARRSLLDPLDAGKQTGVARVDPEILP